MRTVTLNITQELLDISKKECKSKSISENCVVALALKEQAGMPKPAVGYSTFYINGEDGTEPSDVKYFLPPACSNYIYKFDKWVSWRDNPPEPTTFVVQVPEL